MKSRKIAEPFQLLFNRRRFVRYCGRRPCFRYAKVIQIGRGGGLENKVHWQNSNQTNTKLLQLNQWQKIYGEYWCTAQRTKYTKEILIETVQNYQACLNQRFRAFFVVICHLIILVNLFIYFFIILRKNGNEDTVPFLLLSEVSHHQHLGMQNSMVFFVTSVLFKFNCHGWEMSQGDKLENHTKRIHEKFYLTVDCCL